MNATERRRIRAAAKADVDASVVRIHEQTLRELEDEKRVIRVESRSRLGYFHEVRIALDGEAICPCPAGMNDLHCWHQKEAKERYMATQTAVAIRPVVLDRMALVPTTEMIDGVRAAAKLALGGRMTLPKELDSEPKVMAVMMYGLELGLRPMTALKHLYIVDGKVALSSEVMAGMLMRADPKAKLIVEKLEVTGKGETMSGICTMRIIRPGRDIDQRYSVDWEQIKRAGLARNNNLSYPEDRLRYHCTKRLLRTYAPDLINAFDDGPSIGALQQQYGIEGAPHELDAGDNDSLYNDGDEDEPTAEWRDIDTSTGEVRTSTDAQRKAIKELWPIVMADKPRLAEIRAEWPRIFPQPGVGGVNAVNDMTFDEAKTLLLKHCDHDAKIDEDTTLLTCGKCGSVLEDGPPVEAPAAAHAPSLPI